MSCNSRFKCYFGCESDGPLHHFPKPVFPHLEKFNLWKNILARDVLERGDTYIYNQIRLCDRHFEGYYCSPSKRLTANAVPTLHLNAMPQQQICEEIVEPMIVEDLSHKPTTSTLTQSPKHIRRRAGVFQGQKKKTNKLIEKLRTKITKLMVKCKNEKKKVLLAKKICKTKSFMKMIDQMPDSIKTITLMQMKWKKKSRGRRFDLNEKIIALTIYKQSQRAYNLLRKLFVLPSKRTLQKLLSNLCLKPGINSQIMENLKEGVKKWSAEKKLCILMFDEVSLSPGLYYNQQEIIGFEDYGCRKTKKIADHALVFMIKSIKSKTKQPICFTFCQGATKKNDLKNLLNIVIEELTKAGIIIIATICDQASSNTSTINSLREDTRRKYLIENKDYKSTAVEIGKTKIFPLYDTPHLLKGVRNNFLNKDIKFQQNGREKTAKWEHLKMLLDIDTGADEIRLVNKLTECHVNADKMQKMKVKLAAQVFSQRVSSAMRFLATHNNVLPAECEDTADLLLIFDKLFDSFNGHSYNDAAKPLKGCLKNNSPHFQFWHDILPVLETMVFKTIKKQRNGTEIIKFEKIPSLQNWIHNIKTFLEMWEYLKKKYELKSILTRNFNQDPLENFFCCIRSNGIRNVNPTCLQFVNAYKTLLINNFDSPHSINANCENDNNQSIQSLKNLLTGNDDLHNYPDFECDIDSLLITMNEIKMNDSNEMVHVESKKYVAGYIIKKCKTKICKSCINCSNDLLRSEIDVNSFNYEVDYTKKSLFHACDALINLLNEIYYMIVTCMKESPEVPFIKDKIKFFINCRCNFDAVLTCKIHKADLIKFITKLSINLIINSWCTGINRILSGKINKFDQGDLFKLQAFNYYKTHKKYKK